MTNKHRKVWKVVSRKPLSRKQTWPKTYKNNTIALNPLFLPLNGQPLGLPYQPKFFFFYINSLLQQRTKVLETQFLRNLLFPQFHL